jgi:hypothetical protein
MAVGAHEASLDEPGRRVVQVMVDRTLLRRRALESIVAYRAWPKAMLRVNAWGICL